MLAANRIKGIEQKLQILFGSATALSIEPIVAPSTNDCFHVRFQGKSYFCKHICRDLLNQDKRQQLFDLQMHMYELSLAVKPIYYSYVEQLWIEEWVTGDAMSHSDVPSSEKVAQLANVLAGIHSEELANIDVDLAGAWKHYIAKIHTDKESWQAQAEQLLPILQQDQDYCLCHNDLHSQHVYLSETGTQVIDWEYAGIGHRTFDLCATISLNKLTDDEEKQFLMSYSEHTTLRFDSLYERVRNMRPVLEFTNQLWQQALGKLGD